MRLKDIPNLRLTTRQKRLIAKHVNDRKYNGQEVVSERNWWQLPAVDAVHALEAAIESGELPDKELSDMCVIVMKVTEIVEDE